MPLVAQIQELIDKVDTSELVRDQIAAILAVEVTNQVQLAESASRNPEPWRLRIFSERADPWGEWAIGDSEETPDIDRAPIVNVWFDSESFDRAKGNVVSRQQADGVFNIDCYGYGVSSDEANGQVCGDEDAARTVQRAVRLVRNILMSSFYTYLDMQGTVAGRWTQSINMFQPTHADRTPVQNVMAARVALAVSFNEFSPQVQGEAFELLTAKVKRAENGEVILTAAFGA